MKKSPRYRIRGFFHIISIAAVAENGGIPNCLRNFAVTLGNGHFYFDLFHHSVVIKAIV